MLRPNYLEMLEHHYGQTSTWEEASNDRLEYACVYEEAAQLWLKSVLLYNISESEFADKHLIPDQSFIHVPGQDHSSWDNAILRRYSIECATVSLVRNNSSTSGVWLQQALKYHDALIESLGYKDDSEAISDIDTMSAINILMPQMIVKTYLDLEYQDTIELINLNEVESEYIWLQAFALLKAIRSSKPSSIDREWGLLLEKWRQCFVEANFDMFSTAYLALLYDLICQSREHDFSVHILSRELLGHNSN